MNIYSVTVVERNCVRLEMFCSIFFFVGEGKGKEVELRIFFNFSQSVI